MKKARLYGLNKIEMQYSKPPDKSGCQAQSSSDIFTTKACLPLD